MIRRDHDADGVRSHAVYSDCLSYRYVIERVWVPEGRRLTFVMLNPSTATETQNDPTIARCQSRARALGFGGFRACNIFAWRETDPRVLRRVAAPVGPDNDAHLRASLDWADEILCAWGAGGSHRGRGAEVETLLRASGRPLRCLGVTATGAPRHPLYIANRVQPVDWAPLTPQSP